MQGSRRSYHSQGLTRGLAALRLLGKADTAMSLAQMAKELEVPKPTLLRILSVMEEDGFVVKSGAPTVYSLGPSIFDIAESAGSVDFVAVTSPTLKKLADELGFTTNLGVLQGRSVLHLCVEEPARALRIAAGGFLDHAYCTALGKMLISTLDDADIAEHLPVNEPWEHFTPRTLTTREAFDKELELVRKHGYSVDDQERNRGVRCMGVLVPAKSPFPLSLSVSGPVGEISETEVPRVVKALNETARELVKLPRFNEALQEVQTRWGIA